MAFETGHDRVHVTMVEPMGEHDWPAPRWMADCECGLALMKDSTRSPWEPVRYFATSADAFTAWARHHQTEKEKSSGDAHC